MPLKCQERYFLDRNTGLICDVDTPWCFNYLICMDASFKIRLLAFLLEGAWETLTARPGISGAARGINAAVVGLLMTVLYRPVFIRALSTPGIFCATDHETPIVALVAVFAGIGLFLRGGIQVIRPLYNGQSLKHGLFFCNHASKRSFSMPEIKRRHSALGYKAPGPFELLKRAS